jgi:hypothetical protein
MTISIKYLLIHSFLMFCTNMHKVYAYIFIIIVWKSQYLLDIYEKFCFVWSFFWHIISSFVIAFYLNFFEILFLNIDLLILLFQVFPVLIFSYGKVCICHILKYIFTKYRFKNENYLFYHFICVTPLSFDFRCFLKSQVSVLLLLFWK